MKTKAPRIFKISRQVLNLLYLMPTHSYFRIKIQIQKINNYQMIIYLPKNQLKSLNKLEDGLRYLKEQSPNLINFTNSNSKRLKEIRRLKIKCIKVQKDPAS